MKRVIRSSLNSKPIKAADENVDTRLDDALSDLKDDFDYALSGLEKLGRDGANSSNDALAIAETLSNSIQSTIDQIAGAVSAPAPQE
jgi:hypothetical protein|nr:MAG TPA: hypothetical protein [Caudoviricetes sp.]